MNALYQEIKEVFKEKYNSEPLLVRSPGRVNLIGEHTDYNEGFVLPAAIQKEIVLGIQLNNTDQIRIYSLDFKEEGEFDLNNLRPSAQNWANYVLGVIQQFQESGRKITGLDIAFGGNIPIGSGLSSSAALECATAFALNEIYDFKLDREELARVAQKAEHEFVGVRCGIMDQFASLFGKSGFALRLDCRSLEYEYFPLNLEGYKIVLINSMVSHSLASSQYNTRRQECEQGVAIMQRWDIQVQSLRDVSIRALKDHKGEFPGFVYQRCHYVISENQRLLDGCNALKKGDLKAFGKQMYASHEGLQNHYEVSCKELDFLVDLTRDKEEVLGARMMGGGFGGCTINIVADHAIESFSEEVKKSYSEKFKKITAIYICELSDGSSLAE